MSSKVTWSVTSCAMSLSPGQDDHVHAVGLPLMGQRADDVVGLDIRHDQQRQALRLEDLVQGFDLRPEVLFHRLAVRLVFRIQVVAEVFPGSIHDYCHVVRGGQTQLFLQGVDHTENGTGRAPFVIRQTGVYVVGTMQVGGTVDQQQVGPRFRISHIKEFGWNGII